MDGSVRMRWVLAAFGAVAGLVFWGLVEAAERDILPMRLLLVLVAAAGGFFASGLMMAGPLTLRRALLNAAGIGVAAGALSFLASLRFDQPDAIFNSPYPVLALAAVVALPVPFLIAQGGPGWRDYPALFEGSWSIVVRGLVAWMFTGVIWGVIALSDMLLRVVGLRIIGDLAYDGAMPFLITGASLGLALAVVDELAEMIEARLIVRLLRLLAPAVLLVAAVFVLAAPLRGLSNLFEAWSAAGVLMAMGIAALCLLTLVVDRDDAAAPQSPVLRWSARGWRWCCRSWPGWRFGPWCCGWRNTAGRPTGWRRRCWRRCCWPMGCCMRWPCCWGRTGPRASALATCGWRWRCWRWRCCG